MKRRSRFYATHEVLIHLVPAQSLAALGSSALNFKDMDLVRLLLLRHAKAFSHIPEIQAQLVEQTLATVLDRVEDILDGPIEMIFFRAMHKIARRDLDVEDHDKG